VKDLSREVSTQDLGKGRGHSLPRDWSDAHSILIGIRVGARGTRERGELVLNGLVGRVKDLCNAHSLA
jgi:hypothetical protein